MTATDAPGQGHLTFHEKLEHLKQRLVAMSQRAEELLDLSIEALRTGDSGRAEAVLVADRDLDTMEVEIEGLAISLLALQQPMARDLRFIVSAIKITSDLERVGDHAVNIAGSTIRMTALPGRLSVPPQLEEMGRHARSMLGDALDAVMRLDGGLGRQVCARDDAVDALHETLFRSLLTHMMEEPRTISYSLELLLVGRNLERVADLATNIAEDAVYLAEGVSIKHHLEGRPDGSRAMHA
ncbi:MAG TPA: phosphate signaling complex protein PhoU [Gemmatimonadaceae bacterium]|nr:phosphate signaling complex protein PhoU [Gemmatimonadaceae bacterium]